MIKASGALRTDSRNETIFDNYMELEIFCNDIVERAKAYFEQNPKRLGDMSVRDGVEFWIENELAPALDNAVDEHFLEDDDEG